MTELAVIVTGVLIALTADAWYERRSNLGMERDLLEDLYVEFRDNEARLRADIHTNDVSLAAAEELLPLVPGSTCERSTIACWRMAA
jgi:hypothetical protein